MKRVLLGLCALFCGSMPAAASEYAADFLSLGTGAAAAGQGGAYSTSKAGATSFYWNPALILDEGRVKLYAETVSLFDGLSQYQTAALQLRLRKHWALSLGAQMQLDDDIPRYAELPGGRDFRDRDDRSSGTPQGSFEASSRAISVGLSREFWFDVIMGTGLVPNVLPARLAFGGSLRMIDQTLDDVNASGSGGDLGAKLILNGPVELGGPSPKELVLALSLQNLFSQDLEWDTGTKDPLDLNVKTGVSWKDGIGKWPLAYRLALDHDTAWDGVWHLGGELFLGDWVVLRAGGEGSKLDDVEGSSGAGLRWRSLRVDYAFRPHDLGAIHRVSFEVGF